MCKLGSGQGRVDGARWAQSVFMWPQVRCLERARVWGQDGVLPKAAPLASVSLGCSGSQDLLPFQLSHALVLPLGEPSFPQKTACDHERGLGGAGEVVSRLSGLMGADS